jgi:hypothetical protein
MGLYLFKVSHFTNLLPPTGSNVSPKEHFLRYLKCALPALPMSANTHIHITDYYETVQKAPLNIKNAVNVIHNSRTLFRTTELP